MRIRSNLARIGRILAAFLLLALGAAPLPAQPRIEADDASIARFFDAYMTATMKRLDLPGGALVVVRDGRPILAKGYGYADRATKRPVDVETSLFRAASISKLVPWLLVMQLVEEGRLDLDRDVNAYLDFRIPEAFGRAITMRHLMTHSAGFPERFHGVFDQDLSQPLGRRLRDNIPERVHAPGSVVAYSNYGAALAGYIVERLRGEPWKRVVARRFFAPLGMRHSTVLQPVPPALRPRLVSTYDDGSDRPGPFRLTPLAPMGSLTPSAGDMGRLLAALLRGGQGEEGRIVAAGTLRTMLSLQKPLGPGLPDGLGLGFLVGQYRGVRYAGHAGNMTTLATDLELLPDQGLGWYYVFSGQGPGEQARQVRDALLRTAIDRLVAPLAPAPRATGPSSAADVAGDYVSTRRIVSGPLMFSGLLNTMPVKAERDGSLTIETPGGMTRWLPAGRDHFVEATSGVPLAVTRGADGRVARLASAALYPAAEFERAPAQVVWVPIFAAFSFAILLLALPARGLTALVRRRRRRRGKDSSGAPASERDAQVRRWARRAFRLVLATIAAWGLFGIALAIDFTFLFSAPAVLRWLLALLTLLTGPAAVILLADAALAWRDPGRGWATRAGATLLGFGAAGLTGLYLTLHVVDFAGDW
ncbi:MAG: beta-lactamase family protein [Alphaproteobacteria bacterium]|nr:beta-lactamase family protein [Alphaproteobacteria bacterium]MBV9371207.1 beta-lactamase family protein [Alphaproteobacteria bacterium]MBV9899937.1 beta-lactamase family protein [Alphaproteobacteria bacterium]